MSLKEIFGKNVRYFRMKKSYSQLEFSRLAGISRSYLSEVECGKRSISLDRAEVFANALNVSAVELLKERKWPD